MITLGVALLVVAAIAFGPGHAVGFKESRSQEQPYIDFDEIDGHAPQMSDGDNDDIKSDTGFWSTLLGNLKSGDANRWTTVNFAYQIACYQGRGGSIFSKGWWAYKTYNKYGCYCGGGYYSGNYLDATDHCCKSHDICYRGVQKKYKVNVGCHTYTTPYSVSCCKDQKITKCKDSGPSVGRAFCECDQAMAKCVASHEALSTYNKKYMDNRTKCQSTSVKSRKPLSPIEVLRTCKHFFAKRVTPKTTYGSQGSCPAKVGGSKKKGWWLGKRK